MRIVPLTEAPLYVLRNCRPGRDYNPSTIPFEANAVDLEADLPLVPESKSLSFSEEMMDLTSVSKQLDRQDCGTIEFIVFGIDAGNNRT